MEIQLNQNTNEAADLKSILIGYRYEAKAARNLETVARAAGLRRLRPLLSRVMPNDQSLMDRLEDAVDDDQITGEEYDDILQADAIAQARDRNTQEWVYLVAEASVTARTGDVDRAVRRARLLRQATGTRAIPAVIGAEISESAQRQATQEGAITVRLST